MCILRGKPAKPKPISAYFQRKRLLMRTLLVTNDFYPSRGGIESFNYEIARRLKKDELVIYTSRCPGSREFDAQFDRKILRDSNSTLYGSPSQRKRIVKAFKENGCDRVLFGAAAPLALMSPVLRRAGAERIVAISHGHEAAWAKLPAAKKAIANIGKNVDVLTYISSYTKRVINSVLRDEDKIKLKRLVPAVDSKRFYPTGDGDEVRSALGFSNDDPIAICVGRIVERKGLKTLIKAWPKVMRKYPNARLLAVGKGPQSEECRKLADELGLKANKNIVFNDSIPADDFKTLRSWYSAADIFAMPCFTRNFGLDFEGLGIVFLEAASCGKPVIAGHSGGACDAVEHGKTGFLVKGTDPDDVAKRIIQLFDNPQLRKKMGEAGRQRVLSGDWQWNDIAAQCGLYLGVKTLCLED